MESKYVVYLVTISEIMMSPADIHNGSEEKAKPVKRSVPVSDHDGGSTHTLAIGGSGASRFSSVRNNIYWRINVYPIHKEIMIICYCRLVQHHQRISANAWQN